MNSRTVEKKITWKLELTEEEEGWLIRAIKIGMNQDIATDRHGFYSRLLTLVPKEGDDEKDSDSDDDLNFNDLLNLDGPDPDVCLGEAAGSDNPGSGPAVPEHPRSKTGFCPADFFDSDDPQGNMAQRANRPGLDASSTDANLCHSAKLGLLDCKRKDALAEDGDKLSHGSTKPKRDYPYR